jgi:hypothetical protein
VQQLVSVFKTNKPLARAEFRIETRGWAVEARLLQRNGLPNATAVGRAVRLTGTIAPD